MLAGNRKLSISLVQQRSPKHMRIDPKLRSAGSVSDRHLPYTHRAEVHLVHSSTINAFASVESDRRATTSSATLAQSKR